MITHFAELELPTVSLEGAKQFYQDRLGFDVVERTKDRISFRVSPLTTISFREEFVPMKPAHFAFSVPFQRFDQAADHIRKSGILIARWPSGVEVDSSETTKRVNLYFRDGDGNVLEIIAYEHVRQDVLPVSGPLHVMYLREIGFPVQDVGVLRSWFHDNLEMKTAYPDRNDFNFVYSGTAYTVTVPMTRPWVPIAMRALPPDMRVVFGTPNAKFVEEVSGKLKEGNELMMSAENEIMFRYDGFLLGLRCVTNVPKALTDPNLRW